ncbi:MAG: ABC transporter permease [Gammaproteobacteria bacterium]
MLTNTLRFTFILLTLTFAWQLLHVATQLPDYILPSPLQVSKVLLEQSHLLLAQTLPTLEEILLGFILGIMLGCITALIASLCKPFAWWILPLVIISQAIPIFALAPILVIWLGYGMASKITVTALMIFFPVMSAFYDGLKNTPTAWLDLAKTMQASAWKITWHIRIPAALPSLASGIRIAAVIAPMGAIIGEWVGASQGLGYLMMNANARMQIDTVFAALIIITALSLLLYFVVDQLLKTYIWWEQPK